MSEELGEAGATFVSGSVLGSVVCWLAFLPVPTLVAVKLFVGAPDTPTLTAALGLVGGGVAALVVAVVLTVGGAIVVGTAVAVAVDLAGAVTGRDPRAVVAALPPAGQFLLGAAVAVGVVAGTILALVPALGSTVGGGALKAVAGTRWNPAAVGVLPVGTGLGIAATAGFQVGLGWFLPPFLAENLEMAIEILED